MTVAGSVVGRDPETVNPELPTGEFEVRVIEARLLGDADTPPFEIEGFSGEVGEEMRLRYRYLDLRRERMREAIELRHRVAKAIRDFLSDEGFLEIETPMLSRSTPEGARDFLVPSPSRARLLLRAAAVASAVQAAADGGRIRALLPDRALLS